MLSIVERTLAKNGVVALLDGIEEQPYEALRERIEHQVKHLDTLPTLPEIVVKIGRIVNDPEADVADLEEILASDPAVVFKLMRVMKAPAFAGIHPHEWTLREIIVRLGIKKIGAIAQQIKLMNSFALSDDNPFDLRRFWEHAVGSALVADRLCKTQVIALDPPPTFDEYWLSALLHDVGKLVLGLFFPTHFAKVMDQVNPSGSFGRDFREAGAQMGHVGLHEEIGQLLLLQVDAGERIVHAVGNHHTGGKSPDSLSALVHMANNMCKDLGLGYSAGEKGVYSPSVLETLDLTEADVQNLQETMGESMKQEIGEMVDLCIAPRKRPRKSDGGKVDLPATVDEIGQRLARDETLSETTKADLQADVETVRLQLKKSKYNAELVRTLVEPLTQVESIDDLVRQLIQVLDKRD